MQLSRAVRAIGTFLLSCASALTLVLVSASAAAADAYPSKPIRIIVPVVPGGNLDLVFRSLADGLATGLGQAVVVENKAGASSAIGARFVAQSPPDGYMLLAMANTFLTVPAIVPDAGYDPIAEFTAISMVGRLANVLVVPANSTSRTVLDLIARAKARPGEITYASAGSGSVAHLAAERLSRDAGIKMTHIPYKGGGAALIDIAGGRVDMLFEPAGSAATFIRSGQVRGLGVTTKTRVAALPDVPTLDEAGVAGFEDVTTQGLVAPAATPRDVVARLHAEVVKVLARPDIRDRFTSQSLELLPSASPEEFSAFIKSEVARYAKLARDANIKAN